MLDVIGIGLGPFNLSLASLLDESEETVSAKFFEQDAEFNWHKGMILPNTTLQVPFFSDLVTLIDPTSRYSFLNYLHKQHRLLKFYFVEDFFVARKEYNHYCQWVANQIDSLVFSARVIDVIRNENDQSFTVSVEESDSDGQVQTNNYIAKNIVIGTGTHATLPPALQKIADIAPHLCMHSAQFSTNFNLDKLANTSSVGEHPRILVLGSGQSSAEVYRELFDTQLKEDSNPKYQLDWMTRSAGFFPMEYSSLGLEHFSPAYTDHFYQLDEFVKQDLLGKQDLLYKGMGFSTIRDIYHKLYERTIANEPMYSQILSNCGVEDVQMQNEKLVVTAYQKEQKQSFIKEYDCIIAGTGYQHSFPSCFNNLLKLVDLDSNGKPKIERDYRLVFKNNQQSGKVFVQNQELHSHGVGAPDLGLGAYRSGMIANQLLGIDKYDTEALKVFQQFGV